MADRQSIEQTRRYIGAFIAALRDCGHTPENVLAVLEEFAGIAVERPAPDATLIWHAYAVGGGYWGVQVHNPDLRGGAKLYTRPAGGGDAPAPAKWGIDHSTGRPILVYENCSVIEGEQAQYVLNLIRRAAGVKTVDGGQA